MKELFVVSFVTAGKGGVAELALLIFL